MGKIKNDLRWDRLYAYLQVKYTQVSQINVSQTVITVSMLTYSALRACYSLTVRYFTTVRKKSQYLFEISFRSDERGSALLPKQTRQSAAVSVEKAERCHVLQYQFHSDLLRNKSLLFVKPHSRRITAPYVQCQIVTSAVPGELYRRLVQLLAYVLSSQRLVNT